MNRYISVSTGRRRPPAPHDNDNGAHSTASVTARVPAHAGAVHGRVRWRRAATSAKGTITTSERGAIVPPKFDALTMRVLSVNTGERYTIHAAKRVGTTDSA